MDGLDDDPVVGFQASGAFTVGAAPADLADSFVVGDELLVLA